MGSGLEGFAKAYAAMSPDVVLVLGDRSEILSAVSAAIPFNIPVAHIAGGETTQGAMDELIRHAITKIAHIHFPAHGSMQITYAPWARSHGACTPSATRATRASGACAT